MPKISALPPISSLASDDPTPGTDTSAGQTGKWTPATIAAFLFSQMNIPAGASGSPVTRDSENTAAHIVSGIVWSGDAYGSTRNASMTAGVVYINGRRISISAVTARTFTASKDTYVDILDNGDGTGTLVYTEVANNAASPSLAANSLRIAKIITGASNIASAASVIQVGADSLYNIIGNSGVLISNMINLLSNAGVMKSPSGTNYSTTETAVQSLTMTLPAGTKKVLILGSVRLQTQDATNKDVTARVDYDGSATTMTAIFTGVNTFNSANIAIIDQIAATPGSHTFRLLCRASNGSANTGSTNIFIIPLAG